MPSPVTNSWYQLSNNYTGSDSFLSSDGTNGFLSIQNLTSDATNWQFSLSNHSYYIRNQALGASFRLSIAYEQYADQIIPKPAMQKYNATDESQRWLFQGEGNSFAIMNVALGSNLFLNVFSDTLEPYMSTWGGYSSQYWNMEKSPQIESTSVSVAEHMPSTTSSTLLPSTTLTQSSTFQISSISSSTSSPSFSFPSTTFSAIPQDPPDASQPLPIGVILGIGVAVLLFGMFAAMVVGCTIFRYRSRPSRNYGPQDTLISIPEEKAESRQHHDAGGGTLHSVVDERRKKGGEEYELQETFR